MDREKVKKIIKLSSPLIAVLLIIGALTWKVITEQEDKEKVAVVKGERVENPHQKKPTTEEGSEEEHPPQPSASSRGIVAGGGGGSRGSTSGRTSGERETLPLPIPTPPDSSPDFVAPTIDLLISTPFDWAAINNDKLIWAEIKDNVSLSSAALYYKKAVDESVAFSRKDMTKENGDVYKGVIEKEVIKDCSDNLCTVKYYVEAEDSSGNKTREPKQNATPDTYEIIPEDVYVPFEEGNQ